MELVTVIHGDVFTDTQVISENVGNQHKNVLELVRKNQADFEEFGRVAFETRPSETAGGVQNCTFAVLNEPQATLLMTYLRNNEVVRAFKKKLVSAFFEMRKRLQAQQPDLNNPAQLRVLLLDYSEKVLALEADLSEAKPKVAAYERIALADKSLCITDAAKTLQMRPKDLFAWLQRHKWIYRRAGVAHWIGYQDKIQQGLLEHKVTEITRSDGRSDIHEQVRVTPKGLAKVSELLAKASAA